MRKTMPYIIIILFLIIFIASYYGYKYRNYYTPAIPSIKSVKLSDNVVEIKYEIEELKKDKDMYCLKKLATEKIEKEYTLNYYRSFISKKVEVLIEINEGSKSFGYSKEYIYIEVEGNYPCGEIINVQIESVINDRVVGVCC